MSTVTELHVCPAWCTMPAPHPDEDHGEEGFHVDLALEPEGAHLCGVMAQRPNGREAFVWLDVSTGVARLTLAEARALAKHLARLCDTAG